LGARIGGLLPHGFPGKYFLDYAARDKRERYVYDLGLMPAPLRQMLLRPEWQPDRLGASDPAWEQLCLMQQSGATSPLLECMYLDTCHYLPCDILVKVDRMTMAHSIEARPPLLDHEFVEFAASLPVDLKYSRSGRQKHIFKQAAAAVVPAELLDRKKAGFAVPLQSWFAGPLAPLFADCVLSNGCCREYLELRVVRMLFEENRRGRRDHGLKLWAIFLLELWLRRMRQLKSPVADAANHPFHA
jgi:asparagine synthase (glutamine-hydrolysing)